MKRFLVERHIVGIETALIEAADEEAALDKALDDDCAWEQTHSWVEEDMEYKVTEHGDTGERKLLLAILPLSAEENLRGHEKEIREALARLLAPHEGRNWKHIRIGGAWDGAVIGEQVSRMSGVGGNAGPKHETLEANTNSTDAVFQIGTGPDAVLLPSGEWLDRSNYTDDPEPEPLDYTALAEREREWSRGVMTSLRTHPNHIVVGIDYHG